MREPEDDLVECFIFGNEEFSERWDPQENFNENIDLGYIGEDSQGIWISKHPDVCILEDEQLWPIWSQWCTTTWRDITLEKQQLMSNWEIISWLTLMASHARLEAARMTSRNEEILNHGE